MGMEEMNKEIYTFVNEVKSGKFNCSHDVAVNSIKLLKNVINHAQTQNALCLITSVSSVGKKLIELLPLESSVSNMVRRVLKIIREEYTASHKEKFEETDQESLHKIVSSEVDKEDYSEITPNLISSIMDHVSELDMELETSGVNIANQAREHIHSNEIILTVGKSTSVETFLKNAAKDRKFEVIVVECAPSCLGHEMAVNLGLSKIQTTIIADTAVFAIMSRVNKVIIGTHTVLANGGLRAVCGSHTIALAAKHYSVPIIVLAPMYKLSPQYLCSYDQDGFNLYKSPEGILNYSHGPVVTKTRVYNPTFDYVPPELVTLFISNIGGHAPSYVYRLLSELYHPDDYEL